MAGEWLKFESNLPEKPETMAITAAMGWDDTDLTVGKLMRLFRWFDQQTVDGNAVGVTPVLLDKVIGVTGFVQAVINVRWLVVTENGLALHNFDRHNGETAKSRALTAKRVAKHRSNAQGNGDDIDNGNGASVTSALAREEKRREEKKENTAAKAAGDAVAGSPDAIFGDGLAYLMKTGVPERGARSFLGKMRKALNDDLTAVELIVKAQQLEVSDPVAWLRAAAQKRLTTGRTSTGVAL